MKVGGYAGKGASMLSRDLLKAIQDDREREFVAAQRARSATRRTDRRPGFRAWLRGFATTMTTVEPDGAGQAGRPAIDPTV
jgi:hypothetical protein